MNDFLRPCNCEHPTEEDCEKCIGEAAPKIKRPAADVPATPAPKEKPAAAITGRKKH